MSESVKSSEFYDPLGVNEPLGNTLDYKIDDNDFEVKAFVFYNYCIFLSDNMDTNLVNCSVTRNSCWEKQWHCLHRHVDVNTTTILILCFVVGL